MELVPLQDVMVNIRKVKDDTEIDLIRKSISIAEESFQAVRGEIKVGETENHLAGLLILEMRSRGALTSSFEPIVATGASSSLPHYRPGDALVLLFMLNKTCNPQADNMPQNHYNEWNNNKATGNPI